MPYKDWRIVPHKVQPEVSHVMLINFYFVIDENDEVVDRIHAIYDGDGEVALYSQCEECYIDPFIDEPYFEFVHEKLTAHRVVQDALHSIKSPVGTDGIVRPWNMKK